MPKNFSRSFFFSSPVEVAQRLLGARLTTYHRGQPTSGMIVEAEAYCGDTDPACHCYRRRTARTEVMYWEGGYCYVYSIYGLHHCVNVVTGPKDSGAAVLIRAVEPLQGLQFMRRRRPGANRCELTNGPAKLCQALAITKSYWGLDLLTSKRIRLTPFRTFSAAEIGCSTRIGISKAAAYPWRFFVKESPWVSTPQQRLKTGK